MQFFEKGNLINKLVFHDDMIDDGLKKLAEINIGIPAGLTDSEKRVMRFLIEASNVINEIYMKQISPETAGILESLSRSETDVDAKRLKYLRWNMCQWDRRADNKPFIGDEEMPKGACFYPQDMTEKEFADAINSGIMDKNEAKSYYTVIVREAGRLIAKKYSEAYKAQLSKVSELLIEAAKATDDMPLKSYLTETAKAVITNEYTDSITAWMKLDGKISPTIGPFETYDDRLLGLKASFESIVGIRNDEESRKLEIYARYLKEMSESIPIDKECRFSRENALNSPITVVDEVYSGGSANAGYTISAFNLPNDEEIRKRYGSKKVLHKNIMSFLADKLVIPIAEKLLDEKQLSLVDGNTLFKFVLFHELAHGSKPVEVWIGNEPHQTAELLKDLINTFEEARADATGVFYGRYLYEKGIMEKGFLEKLYATYFVGGLLRATRNGVSEAHGAGCAMQYNYVREKGAINFDADTARLSIKFDVMNYAMLDLVKELNSIEAFGDYEKAKAFYEKYAYVPKELQSLFKKIDEVPASIMPIFTAEMP